MTFSRAAILAVALSSALLVAGCGVKPSQLEPPADSDPKEVRDPTIKKAPPKDGEKPDKPFILDGLVM
jgi:hypothetical protein